LKKIIAILVLAAFLPSQLGAWGSKGHAIVADIATAHLAPVTAANLHLLLGNDSLASIASWADQVRKERDESYGWHYVDIPKDAPGFSEERDCFRPQDKHKDAQTDHHNCVVDRIEMFRKTLADENAPRSQRLEALKWLVHFVGDLHQPLHAINNADNGGNCVAVKYFRHDPLPSTLHPEREDYSPNLHQIWDTEIVERDMEISNPLRYADELDEKFHAESAAWEAAGIRVDNWAWESHERAETAVYDAFPEKIAIEPDVKLKSCAENNHMGKRMFEKHLAVGEAYQNGAAKSVEMGLAEAGVRLAMILNDAAKAAN
jgi:hypothetical protein